mmetsp:Transcript_13293/g.21716  ORF Transcript_13293/g.21716 Transcript_13293/m.21716 type:complete len:202 (-) Transcript_13293:316-921(-)
MECAAEPVQASPCHSHKPQSLPSWKLLLESASLRSSQRAHTRPNHHQLTEKNRYCQRHQSLGVCIHVPSTISSRTLAVPVQLLQPVISSGHLQKQKKNAYKLDQKTRSIDPPHDPSPLPAPWPCPYHKTHTLSQHRVQHPRRLVYSPHILYPSSSSTAKQTDRSYKSCISSQIANTAQTYFPHSKVGYRLNAQHGGHWRPH